MKILDVQQRKIYLEFGFCYAGVARRGALFYALEMRTGSGLILEGEARPFVRGLSTDKIDFDILINVYYLIFYLGSLF